MYSIRDPICDVINYFMCFKFCYGKIKCTVYDQIVLKNLKTRRD